MVLLVGLERTGACCRKEELNTIEEKPLHEQESWRRRRSYVRFDESQNMHHKSTERCSLKLEVHYRSSIFYSDEDYQLFRDENHDLGNEIEQRQRKCPRVKVLEKIFNAIHKIDHEVDDVSELFSSQEVEELMYQRVFASDFEWCVQYVGMEDRISTKINMNQLMRKQAVLETVQDIQDEIEMGVLDEEDAIEDMRDSCQRFSQTSLLFAQLMAKGFASAALLGAA